MENGFNMRNERYINAINNAKKLMYEHTLKNKAPSWLLTSLAQEVGGDLKYMNFVH